MCTTCKDKLTPGAPAPDEYTYSVAGAPAGARVEYKGQIYSLEKLTCCQKRLLFGKTPYITRALTQVAAPEAPAEEAPTGIEAPAEATTTPRRKRS
jgi:hypothetical protein